MKQELLKIQAEERRRQAEHDARLWQIVLTTPRRQRSPDGLRVHTAAGVEVLEWDDEAQRRHFIGAWE
jgi:hypothetical protein